MNLIKLTNKKGKAVYLNVDHIAIFFECKTGEYNTKIELINRGAPEDVIETVDQVVEMLSRLQHTSRDGFTCLQNAKNFDHHSEKELPF